VSLAPPTKLIFSTLYNRCCAYSARFHHLNTVLEEYTLQS